MDAGAPPETETKAIITAALDSPNYVIKALCREKALAYRYRTHREEGVSGSSDENGLIKRLHL
jgi:hypothetical protein